MIVDVETSSTRTVRFHRRHSPSTVSLLETVPVEVAEVSSDDAPLAAVIFEPHSERRREWVRFGEHLLVEVAAGVGGNGGDPGTRLAAMLRTEGEGSDIRAAKADASEFGRVAADHGDAGSRAAVLEEVRSKAAELLVRDGRIFRRAPEPVVRLMTFGFDRTLRTSLETGGPTGAPRSRDWSIAGLDALEAFLGRGIPEVREAVVFADPRLLIYDQTSNHLAYAAQDLMDTISDGLLRTAPLEVMAAFATARDALEACGGRVGSEVAETLSDFADAVSRWSDGPDADYGLRYAGESASKLAATLDRLRAEVIEADEEHAATAGMSF